MRRSRSPHRLSLTALGAIGVVVLLVFCYLTFTKRVPLVEGYRVNGVFTSANQLRSGSPVRIAGVDVGKVVGIEDGPGTSRIVEMELEETAKPIHADATLRIRPRLFLEGGFYLELRPGSPSAPEIADGGTIPLSATRTTVQFHQILAVLDTSIRESLQRTLGELRTALDDGGAEELGRLSKPLAPTFREVARTAEAARGSRPDDVSTLVASSSAVADALGRREEQLKGLVTSLDVTARALADNDEDLAAGVRELDRLLANTPDALAALDRVNGPLRQLVTDLRPSLRAAPPVLAKTNATLAQLGGLVRSRELPALVAGLEPAVTKLPGLTDRLRDTLPLAEPVADCLRDRALPVLLAEAPDGELSTHRPIWQDLAHAAVGFSSAGQNFDGNGHAVRYNGGAGDLMVSLGGLPGTPTLFGRAENPIAGARPVWYGPNTADDLPFVSDQECRDQDPPDLSARTSPSLFTATPTRPARPVTGTRAQLGRLLGAAERAGREQGATR